MMANVSAGVDLLSSLHLASDSIDALQPMSEYDAHFV